MSWRTRTSVQVPNCNGSMTQCAVAYLGEFENTPVHCPVKELAPLMSMEQIVMGGWDINAMNIYESTLRAQVLQPEFIDKIRPEVEQMKPLPSVYYADFIASNQSDRADNVLPMPETGCKWDHVETVRAQIREFKQANNLDNVVVFWTANTERFAELSEGVNDTWANLENTLKTPNNWESEVAPSTIFAIASLLEGFPFVNGSPQNTFVPGFLDLVEQKYTELCKGELAQDYNVLIAGDDLKTGQTKLKSVLAEYLVGAGIKTTSIVSYNHLGNNDGKNLTAGKTFKSKEISKAGVVDDIVKSNPLLYGPNEHPDHLVVIKYIPTVGDSKRALDEYISEIAMGGTQQFVIHNTCEDSLLAFGVILDLCIMAELFTRIKYSTGSEEYVQMNPIMSLLAYWCKAPLFQAGVPAVNALGRQRVAIENFLKILAGVPISSAPLLTYAAPVRA